MLIRRVRIKHFKGIDVDLPFDEPLVLFGSNDAGKTNTIEALDRLFRGDDADVRDDALEGTDQDAFWRVVLALDGHVDRQTLADLLRAGESSMFPRSVSFRVPGGFARAIQLHLDRGGTLEYDEDGTFLPPWSPPSLDDLDIAPPDDGEPLELETLIAVVREEVERASLAEVDLDVHDDVRLLLDQCFGSARFEYYTEGGSSGVWWLAPRTSDCPTEVLAAAHRIAARADAPLWLLEEFVRALTEGSDEPAAFLQIAEAVDFRPFDVVLFSASPSSVAELHRRAEATLGELAAHRRGWSDDPWIESDDATTFRISDALVSICAEVSEEATSLAPGFVRAAYRIVVSPIAPNRWRAAGARVRIGLAPVEETSDDPLGVSLDIVGSGIATWAGYSVEAALRSMQRRTFRQGQGAVTEREGSFMSAEAVTMALLDEPDAASGTEDDEAQPVRPPLYLIDEPERHLHPAAQEDVAAFVANSLGTYLFVVATHAPAFLDLPRELIRVVHLRRVDGATRSETLPAGVLAWLDDNLAESGFTRSSMLQLVRAVLFVEGEHERTILTAFYGERLARARVRVLSLRGANEALGLAEAEFLGRLGIRLFVMLDRTRDEMIEAIKKGSVRPSELTPEEQHLAKLQKFFEYEKHLLHPVDFPLRDIICALPEAAVRRHAPGFPGWEAIVEEFDGRRPGTGFKCFVRERLNLRGGTESFIDAVIENARELGVRPAKELERAIKRVEAEAAAP